MIRAGMTRASGSTKFDHWRGLVFGLSKQERVGEALRRATAGALTGAFLPPSEIDNLNLNNEASSWIFTESLSQLIFCLVLVYSNSEFSNEPWANSDFFDKNVSSAIADHEREMGLSPGTVIQLVFSRIHELIPIYQGNIPYQHIRDSAIKAKQKDPRANSDKIFDVLNLATDNYFREARKMF